MTRRAAFYCWLLFGLWAFLAVLLGRDNLANGKLLDFASFWAAGRLAVMGTPALAWDLAAHEMMMVTALGTVNGIMPFAYPPPMLLLVAPFALPPYAIAFALWVASSFLFYLWQARRLAPPALAAAQPSVLINLLIGQNGFWSGGFLLGGASLLSDRPFRSGVVLGLLVIKPQLALMLPMAVIAARRWSAIAGALVSAGVLLTAAWFFFGTESYRAFLALLPLYGEWMGAGRFDLIEFASTYALLKTAGLPHAGALLAHILIALLAAVLCWRAWSKNMAGKVAVLCAASMLASPYLQAYDNLPMLAPIAFLASRRPTAAAALFGLLLIAVGTQAGFWSIPNLTPVAAILALWWCREEAGERSPR